MTVCIRVFVYVRTCVSACAFRTYCNVYYSADAYIMAHDETDV